MLLSLPRIPLVHGPTPLRPLSRLGAELGIDLWVKRDDMTGGADAGNKLRKLELLFAEALARGATHVVTCGGIQSNHARATALVAASLGIRAVLLLRTTSDAERGARPSGNVLLDRLAGAEIRWVTPDEYRRRADEMASVAETIRRDGGTPYVIPEGGSNALGAMGYALAMCEIREQVARGEGPSSRNGIAFDSIVLACGSGGTAAGAMLGAAREGVAAHVVAIAVCDDEDYFRAAIDRLCGEADARYRLPGPSLTSLDVIDGYKGPGYAQSYPEMRATMLRAARTEGLVLDPVYTGKAFHALCTEGRALGNRVLFLHTGGLPGLLASGADLADDLRS
ncbi:MAG: D-cysteine desulfhydrase family protein [Deltaproteobacteria bacterium]|nr:D-cysteine desulfhydrase family protein [Deltaproteobacteria bacterium]